MTSRTGTPGNPALFARLASSFAAIANPCCHGESTSLFQVIGLDGQPTGDEVCLCNGCNRQLAPLANSWVVK